MLRLLTLALSILFVNAQIQQEQIQHRLDAQPLSAPQYGQARISANYYPTVQQSYKVHQSAPQVSYVQSRLPAQYVHAAPAATYQVAAPAATYQVAAPSATYYQAPATQYVSAPVSAQYVSAPAQVHYQAPAQIHYQAPAQVHYQAPVQVHYQAPAVAQVHYQAPAVQKVQYQFQPAVQQSYQYQSAPAVAVHQHRPVQQQRVVVSQEAPAPVAEAAIALPETRQEQSQSAFSAPTENNEGGFDGDNNSNGGSNNDNNGASEENELPKVVPLRFKFGSTTVRRVAGTKN